MNLDAHIAELTPTFPRQLAPVLLLVLAALALSAAPAAKASYPKEEAAALAAEGIIGEVSLVIGKAWLRSADERGKRKIASGAAVRPHDRVVTESNGHVHIRFIDQALVSVRPDSRLEITRYDYNEEDPTQSTIKFTLEEGVTRSISGEAARNARDRYRMNTPIAAIGVRGTDFVVSATQRTVHAQVKEGAIVVAPFSASCLPDAFGPCTFNALELTGETREVLELQQGQELPTLLEIPDTRIPELMRQRRQVARENAESGGSSDEEKDLYLDSVSFRTAEEVTSSGGDQAPEPAAKPTFTPEAPRATEELTDKQLVWGRWANGRGEQERITIPFEQAREDPRAITVANNRYGLYRSEPDGTKRVQPGLGPISFTLDSAQAFFNGGQGAEAMDVLGGTLNIDIGQRHFDTLLNLDHRATGQVDFSASGSIDPSGFFHSRGDLQSMAGAVSLDGEEAGYFFKKQLDTGNVEGLTLWGRE